MTNKPDPNRHPFEYIGGITDKADRSLEKYKKYRPNRRRGRPNTDQLTEEYQVRNGTYWRFSNRRFPLGSVPNDYLSNDQLAILRELKNFPEIQEFLTRHAPERWSGSTHVTTHFPHGLDIKVTTETVDFTPREYDKDDWDRDTE